MPAATSATQQAAEQKVCACCTVTPIASALLQQRLCALENVTFNQRVVKSREALIAPVDTADIRLVGEYPQHDRRLPAARRRGRLFCVEATGYRRGSQPPGRVPLEDSPDDRRGALVGDQLLLLVACVSERNAPVRPPPFLGAPLDARGHAVDDRCMLELGEDAEHLKHHPAGRCACVERLGRRAQDHVEPCQLLGDARELAHLAAESVDAVDEKLVDPALAC
jgi:hypothetical protein